MLQEEYTSTSFQHSQRDFSSTNLLSDNTHVGAGTRWQHRTCPTLVKNLHCFWPGHVLPKAGAIFASGLQQSFQSILHLLKQAFGQALY